MKGKYEVFRCVEVILYTVLSFVLAAIIMHLIRSYTGWTYSEWSRNSQICVHIILVVVIGSIFCKVYEGVDYILGRIDEKKSTTQAAPAADLEEACAVEDEKDDENEEENEDENEDDEKKKKFVIVDFHM